MLSLSHIVALFFEYFLNLIYLQSPIEIKVLPVMSTQQQEREPEHVQTYRVD